MHQSIRDHQIEQILLCAHTERKIGVDLIEEYFLAASSLDEITKYAKALINQTDDPRVQEAVVKNLSECIVVKMQREKRSLMGFFRKILMKFGVSYKSGEIERAERFIQQVCSVCDHFPSRDASEDE